MTFWAHVLSSRRLSSPYLPRRQATVLNTAPNGLFGAVLSCCLIVSCGQSEEEQPQEQPDASMPMCGDSNCEEGESVDSCPYDCGFCGDGVCSIQIQEDHVSCREVSGPHRIGPCRMIAVRSTATQGSTDEEKEEHA